MNINKLRSDFLKIIRKNRLQFTKVSEEIGIAYKTLKGFMDGSLKTHVQSLWLIEEWIAKHKLSKD